MLLRAFGAAGRQPERMDLAALKRRMGQNLDIYIIDGQGVIRWTTDTSARNFDFHAFGHKGDTHYAPEAAFQQIIRKVVSRKRLEIRNGTALDVYRYVDLASLKPSVSNPSKIVRIRYTLAPVRAELHRIAAFGLASIIIAVLALSVTVSGLAVVRGMHGGIAVESRADKGTYITICLPTVERDQTADESEN